MDKSTNPDSGILISVVICSYNRAELLKDALQSVCDQTFDKARYELIVSDSDSPDSTAQLAAEFGARYPNVHYCTQSALGLSRARNLGWQTARGKYVAYIDDDCRVPPEWLTVAEAVIADEAPGAFGGPIRPLFEANRPQWFKESYGIHQPFDNARSLANEQEITRIFGGNAFFRRDLLEALGGFDPDLSMFGDKISFGEDTAFLKLIHRERPGEVIYYDPKLFLYHLMRPVTMTWRYNIPATFEAGRVQFNQNRAGYQVRGGRIKLWLQSLRTVIALAMDLIRGTLKRDRQAYPYLQNYLYEHSLRYIRRLGRLNAQLNSL